jgi:hypothetical protein
MSKMKTPIVAGSSSGDPRTQQSLAPLVWAVRRDLGRLLRAMNASGVGIHRIEPSDYERLVRCEGITADFLSERASFSHAHVRAAALELRAVEGDIVRRLGRAALAELRRHEHDLSGCPSAMLSVFCGAAEGAKQRDVAHDALDDKSLAAGLARLSRRRLDGVMERLGVSGAKSSGASREQVSTGDERRRIEGMVADKLRDEGLLRILVATLSTDSRRLLRAILLEELNGSFRERLGATAYRVPSADRLEVASPIQSLCKCAIVFAERGELWIPADLQAPLLRILEEKAPKPRFLV